MTGALPYRGNALQGDGAAMPGALVISLDFELHWGVYDHTPLHDTEKARLLAARAVVPRILELFQEFSVHTTWAIVGLLFARSREEAEQFRPCLMPSYSDPRMNPYSQGLGESEEEDPYHFAPSLIEQIAKSGGQEIGSHSFSHFRSLEEGHGAREFEADLESAVSIAEHFGHRLQSFVFPRNEIHAAYLPLLADHGFRTYRETEDSAIKRSGPFAVQRQLHRRAGRFLDSYIDILGGETAEWPGGQAPAPVPASRYLRPCRIKLRSLQPLLIERIRSQMAKACEEGRIFHLWWHPEDFALQPECNLRSLRRILAHFQELKTQRGMVSLNMSETISMKVSQIKEMVYNATYSYV